MTVADPFTSENARVVWMPETQAAKLIASVRAPLLPKLAEVFGNRAWLDHKSYFGSMPEWVAGYRSECGFHVRGRGVTAEAAVAAAIAGRLAVDPSPQNPNLAPAGTYLKGD